MIVQGFGILHNASDVVLDEGYTVDNDNLKYNTNNNIYMFLYKNDRMCGLVGVKREWDTVT